VPAQLQLSAEVAHSYLLDQHRHLCSLLHAVVVVVVDVSVVVASAYDVAYGVAQVWGDDLV
jgi:hypothetical protein